MALSCNSGVCIRECGAGKRICVNSCGGAGIGSCGSDNEVVGLGNQPISNKCFSTFRSLTAGSSFGCVRVSPRRERGIRGRLNASECITGH